MAKNDVSGFGMFDPPVGETHASSHVNFNHWAGLKPSRRSKMKAWCRRVLLFLRSLVALNPPANAKTPPRLANDNPWYCLATLHGEQPLDRLNQPLADQNCRTWNQWISEALNDHERAELTQKFAQRTSLQLPKPTDNADFSRTHFERSVIFAGFHFPMRADFRRSKFSRDVNFRRSQFDAEVDLQGATLHNADFASTTFSSRADFRQATFSAGANFDAAIFSSLANFDYTTFLQPASFDAATFSGSASFDSATFCQHIGFVNATFATYTSFAHVHFKRWVPDFRGATMHEATAWHSVTWPTPPDSDTLAQYQVYAYERLKQEMERLKKHEDEQIFFRKELRARRGLVRTFSGEWVLNLAYQALSDYGNSISRPLLWLFGVFAAGTAIFARAPLYCGVPMPIKLAAKLSFANIFLFLPDKRELMMTEKMNACLSNTTQAVSAMQALLGLVLLFLVGLALRNRFRMK